MQSRNGLAEVSFLLVLVVYGVGGFVTPPALHQQPNRLQQQHHDHAHSRLSGLAPAPSWRRPVALCSPNSRAVRARPLTMNGAGGDSQVCLAIFGLTTSRLCCAVVFPCLYKYEFLNRSTSNTHLFRVSSHRATQQCCEKIPVKNGTKGPVAAVVRQYWCP